MLHLEGYSVCNYIGGNCIQHPPGQIPRACLPQPDNTAPPPVIQKPSSYGAVASNSVTGLVGTASKQASKQASIDLAMQRCGSGCELRTWYANQCMAYVHGKLITSPYSGRSYIHMGLTKKKAESSALAECRTEAKNCKVFLSECSLP